MRVVTDISGGLGDHIAAGLNAHADHLRHEHQEHRKAERLDFLEHLESEGVEAIGKILGDRLRCEDLPPEIAALVGRICNPEHPAELGAIAGILVAIGYIIGQALMAGPASTLAMSSMYDFGSFPLDPNAVADAVNRDRFSDVHGAQRARDSGVSADKWDDLKKMAAQTLAPGQWIEFWQRYPELEATVDEGLSHSGLDERSVAAVKALHWAPMDIGTAIAAVTQNQIDMPTFERLLGQGGINPEWAKIIFESSGATMPPDMAMRLFREGWIDQAKFEEILTESNLKNKYVPLMANLQYRYPPMEQTLRMYRHGVIDDVKAREYLQKQGFFPDDARRLVESAASSTATTNKHLTPSVIERLYEVGRFSRGEAAAQLVALGYDSTEAELLLFLADEMKAHAQVERAATSIGTRYVSWKIDRGEAVLLLDRVNVPSAQRDEMLEIWDARREAQTLHLSEAFLHKAHKMGAIDRADVERRLLAMGYDRVDTDIIMATDFGDTATKPKTKDLTRADEVKRYSEGIINRATLHGRLTAMGYDTAEADQIIELADLKLAEAAAKDAPVPTV